MLFQRTLLALLLAVTLNSLACIPVHSQAEVTPIEKEIGQGDLELFDVSATFSQALAVNTKGQMLGLRETSDETGSIFSNECFFLDGGKLSVLPQLEGYTSMDAHALSDNGLVVGYASRPMGHSDGSLTAIVWDTATGKLTNLGAAPGDRTSHAQDISADGRRITGYSTGTNPPRLRPCVWTRQANTDEWTAETLPVLHDNNPYLMSSHVLISPDGQRIAACISVKVFNDAEFDSSLHVWELDSQGWQRRLISDEQFHLKDINNAGEIVGASTQASVRIPCHMNLQGQFTLLDLLPDDVSGEARAVDPGGTVIGFSDDPPGPTGGPQAFVWRAGKTQPLSLSDSELPQFSAAYDINIQGQIVGLLDYATSSTDASPVDSSDGKEQVQYRTMMFRLTPKNP